MNGINQTGIIPNSLYNGSMLKAFKYRIYPSEEQETLLKKHFGCCRFIYNWGLENKKKLYESQKVSISCFDLMKHIPEIKKDKEWLSEVNSQSLQQSLHHLNDGFLKFFKKKAGFPKFKSKYEKQSFQCPQSTKVDFEKSTVSIPKILNISVVFSRKFEGKIKTTTISRTKTNKYYISILVDDGKELPLKPEINESKTIGVDLGLKDFLTTSSGEKISNLRFGQDQRWIKRHQRQLVRRKKKGQNRQKTKFRIARDFEKIRNRRTDFLQKLSTKLIRENQTICLEDLNVQGMMANHKLAGSIGRVAWGEFVSMLKYKSDWYGKNLLQIGRFEPSSKTCSVCGWVKKDLTLEDREWICQGCGAKHDRDVNAAQNIKAFALKKILPMDSRDFKPVEMSGCRTESLKQELVG